MDTTFNINKIKVYLNAVHYYVIAVLIVTFPYYISSSWIGTLAILSFLIMLVQRLFRWREFLGNKVIVALFVFILFTYLSVLWSDISVTGKGSSFETNFDRFKYYFFLIPSIYFSSFSRKQIRNLVFVGAISSVPLIILNYTNAIGITHYYAIQHGGDSEILGSRLKESIFILFTALYLYIQAFVSIKQKKYHLFVLFFILYIITSYSLQVDKIAMARIAVLTNIIIFVVVPFFFLKRKYLFILPLIIMVVSIVIFQNDKIRTGITEFKESIENHVYEGSWGLRTAYIIIGLKIFKKHPFIGSGINDTDHDILDKKRTNPEYFEFNPKLTRLHNDHLNILIQTGLVGYTLFVYFVYLFVRLKLKDEFMYVYKNIFLLCFLILMLAEHYLTDKFSTNLFAIMVSLILLYRKREDENESRV